FASALLDETCDDLRDMVQGILAPPTELVGIETPPASVKLNLLPDSWRQRRAQLVKRGKWQKRLTLAGGAYAAIFLLFLLYLAYSRFAIARLDRLIARDAPQTQFIRETEDNWKAIAPAIDSRFYPVEILLILYESLSSSAVIILYTHNSSRQIT